MLRMGKNNKEGKKEVLDFFSELKWNDLSSTEKKQHKLFNCQGCQSNFLYRTKLAMFDPTKCHVYLSEAQRSGLLDTKEQKEWILQAMLQHFFYTSNEFIKLFRKWKQTEF